jgi:hypothetical protein
MVPFGGLIHGFQGPAQGDPKVLVVPRLFSTGMMVKDELLIKHLFIPLFVVSSDKSQKRLFCDIVSASIRPKLHLVAVRPILLLTSGLINGKIFDIKLNS